MTSQSTAATRTSHGHEGSTSEWLDLHFEVNRTEYESALRMVGFEPGWHVLDAGCGVGNYVPLIAEIVGMDGKITALDLEADNVAAVQERFDTWNLDCHCEALVGSVLSLPLEDDSVDAVWCAHVLAYLDDEAAAAAVREFSRVVRPGGIIALKDLDLRMITMGPDNPALLWHVFEDWFNREEWSYGKGAMRSSWGMSAMLDAGGLTGVWQRSMPIERRTPLSSNQRQQILDTLRFWSELALEQHLPDAEHRWWRQWGDDETAEDVLSAPDFYWREGQVVAVGTVAEASRQAEVGS
ncbi:MAG: class I SAM-dependent methyltransferase [Thermomicrobiales bacterium]